VNTISSEVSKHTNLSAQAIIAAGATNLHSLTSSPAVFQEIQSIYSLGVRNVMYFSTGLVALALPLAFGMEWVSVKKEKIPSEEMIE